ncbi:MAG: LysR family transcriptional regulator [Oscillospiraceae bacterium]|nr:LysR family transcriptional regulator [Oscillospiraceae bacterium]
MDSKKVHALLLAVERGSLTSAAAELGYTQSGLTHMMNALEEEVGLNLLVRSKNGVRLSPAGQALKPKMQAFLDASLDLEEEAAHLRQRSSSTLRLGSYSSIASTWLPAIVASFRKVDPNTDVIIDVGGIPDIYEKLKTDQLDCAFVSYQESLCTGLHYFHLADDPLIAILPETDSHEGVFPISDFSEQEFLMPSDGFDIDILPLFSRYLGKDHPRIRYTNLSDSAIVSMVEHNLGISLLSELIMEDIHSSVRTLPLDPPIFRKLGIAASDRQQNDKVIRRFIRCAQTVIGEMLADSAGSVV